MPIRAIGPAPGACCPDHPRGCQHKKRCEQAENRPGQELGRAHHGEQILREKRLRELPEGQHECAHPGVVLDLEAEVRVLVHLGEEVGVRALLDQPALALELGGHGLVGLVEQAQPVEARDAGHRAAAQGR